MEESVKKVKKLSETSVGDSTPQNFLTYILPNEMDLDIKPCIEKLVKVCRFHSN